MTYVFVSFQPVELENVDEGEYQLLSRGEEGKCQTIEMAKENAQSRLMTAKQSSSCQMMTQGKAPNQPMTEEEEDEAVSFLQEILFHLCVWTMEFTNPLEFLFVWPAKYNDT